MLGDAIARDISAVVSQVSSAPGIVIDLFAGPCNTQPPIADVVGFFDTVYANNRLLYVTQVHEIVNQDSLTEVSSIGVGRGVDRVGADHVTLRDRPMIARLQKAADEQPSEQQTLDTGCSRAGCAGEDHRPHGSQIAGVPLEDTHMTKRIATMLTKGLIAATLLGSLAGSAAAQTQTQTEPNRPATAAMDRGTTDPVDTRDHRPNWGLLGLIGLAGLAGLRRRNDAKDYRSDRSDHVGATGTRG